MIFVDLQCLKSRLYMIKLSYAEDTILVPAEKEIDRFMLITEIPVRVSEQGHQTRYSFAATLHSSWSSTCTKGINTDIQPGSCIPESSLSPF